MFQEHIAGLSGGGARARYYDSAEDDGEEDDLGAWGERERERKRARARARARGRARERYRV